MKAFPKPLDLRFLDDDLEDKPFGRNHGAVQYAIRNNQRCAGRKWEVIKQQSNNSQTTVKQQANKAMRRVRSDRGEEYRSATAAAKAMGLSRGSVNDALRYGHKAGGRRWHVVPNYTPRHITAVQPSELPTEIVDAALLLTNFFEARGDSYWKYMGLASRTALEDCENLLHKQTQPEGQ